MGDLKCCPFCGGEAEIVYTAWCGLYSVRCSTENQNCEVMPETRGFPIEREAVEVWNRRAGGGNGR